VTVSPARAAGAEADIGQAPGELAKLQAFVNTLDIERGTDELTAPAALDAWLDQAGLMGHRTSGSGPADLARAIELREALRGVLSTHVAHRATRAAAAAAGSAAASAGDSAARLAAIAATLRPRLTVTDGGRIALSPAETGSQAAVTRLLLIAADADIRGTWNRLKVCSADDCRWAFYDRSPTRSGCWCSMQVCGSRAKSRAYRKRAARAR
jgi:predicted RNA-binding Zn ribbon-like protein